MSVGDTRATPLPSVKKDCEPTPLPCPDSYNFIEIHRTHRVTPAMAAGVTDRLCEDSGLVALPESGVECRPCHESFSRGRTVMRIAQSGDDQAGEDVDYPCGRAD
jgi:hypothetical protein